MSIIKNKDKLDQWLFEHAVLEGHVCSVVKNNDGVNIAWIDAATQEKIDIIYEESWL